MNQHLFNEYNRIDAELEEVLLSLNNLASKQLDIYLDVCGYAKDTWHWSHADYIEYNGYCFEAQVEQDDDAVIVINQFQLDPLIVSGDFKGYEDQLLSNVLAETQREPCLLDVTSEIYKTKLKLAELEKTLLNLNERR